MKFSMFNNDKSTYWDEVILGIIVLITIGVGVALIILKPVVWFIDGNNMTLVGVMLILIGAMFFPGFIYRLFHNDKHNRAKYANEC